MSIETIASALAYFEVSREEFFSKSRFPRHVIARHAVAYVLKKRDDISYPNIGQRLKRDHSTIIHAVEKLENKTLAFDDELRTWVDFQMALPRHHRTPVYIENPYRLKFGMNGREEAPKRVENPIVLPKFEPVEKPPERVSPYKFRVDESVMAGSRLIHMNKDGNCKEDQDAINSIEKACIKLAKKIRSEHPERFAA